MLLVAGTCIGGGMLALPVACASAGFVPSSILMLIVWAAMTLTGIFFVEAGFWVKKEDAHVITLSETLLGPWAKRVAWCVFLFIAYASLVAYTAGGGHVLAQLANHYGFGISKNAGALLFICLFGPSVLMRHTMLGKMNALFFFVMLGAYILLIATSSQDIQLELVMRQDWSKSIGALPLLLTAFSYQAMVPSLHPYLDHHKKSLIVAIAGGTALAGSFYLVWQLVVFGNVPLTGDNSLQAAFALGEPATYALAKISNSSLIGFAAATFAFFALITSFFGISLGLFDFLSDGLSIPKTWGGSFVLALLILVPCALFATNYERIFLEALDASGGFGDTIVNGIIPVLLVWKGRYILGKGHAGFQRVSSKPVLIGALLFYLLSVGVEITSRMPHRDARETTVEEIIDAKR